MSGRGSSNGPTNAHEQENNVQSHTRPVKPNEGETRRALQDVSNRRGPKVSLAERGSQHRHEQPADILPDAPEDRLAKRHRSDSIEVDLVSSDKRSKGAVPGSVSVIPHKDFIRRIDLDNSAEPEPLFDEEGNELEDDDDPQMCAEYADVIYDYMYLEQERYMVDPASVSNAPASMDWPKNRLILVNWLSSIHRKFRLVAETLYLAVNILDRFLEKENLSLDKAQLLGTASLFLAAKYEEVMTPSISHFAYVATATDEEVRQMERRILIVVQFELGYPNPLNFLRRISRADDYDVRSRTVAKFLLEIILYEQELMSYRPSDVAAASMFLAREILELGPWTANFVYYSGGCTTRGLQPIARIMEGYLLKEGLNERNDLMNKYRSKRFLKAAVVSVEWALRRQQEERDSTHTRAPLRPL